MCNDMHEILLVQKKTKQKMKLTKNNKKTKQSKNSDNELEK